MKRDVSSVEVMSSGQTVITGMFLSAFDAMVYKSDVSVVGF